MDVMALGIAIKADDTQALAAFKGLETAGRQTASVVTTNIAQATAALNTLGISARTASINGIDKIVVSGAQLEQTNAILARMGGGLKAVEIGAKSAAQATEQVATAAKASTASYQKWGNAAIRGAGALMLMGDAMSGNDKSMQKILKTGSSIAFMFGPTGAIVGSVGIATSLIVDLFTKASDEMKKMETAFQESLAKIRRSFDVAGAASAVDTADLAFQKAQQDQVKVERELADARKAATREASIANVGRVNQLESELVAVKALVATEERRWAEAIAALGDVSRVQDEAAEGVKRRTAAGKEAEKQMENEAGWLERLRDLGGFRAMDLNRARTLELQYAEQLKAGNLSLADRIILLDKLTSVQAAQSMSLSDMVKDRRLGGDVRRGESTGDITGSAASGAAAAVSRNIAALVSADMAGLYEVLNTAGGKGAAAFASGLTQGLSGAFDVLASGGGVFEGIEALGKGLLASFGQMLQQFGVAALAANEWIMGIFAGLGGPAGIAAAIGLIALGTALSGLAGGRGGGGRKVGGGGGYAYAGGGMENNATRYSYNPATGSMREAQPSQSNTYVIMGSNPQLERFIAKVSKKGDRRGLRGRGIVRINGERV